MCEDVGYNLPLVMTRHRNRAATALGEVYRLSTNPPTKYPEIGVIEVTNAIDRLAMAYAEIEFLKSNCGGHNRSNV
jgi:hypothetical protein